LPFRIIPVILISNGGVIKTRQFKRPRYVGDPINTVKIFNEKGVDELIIIDIEASKRNEINFTLVEEIASEAFIPITYGGGIKSIADVERLFSLGIEKISVNQSIISGCDLLGKCVERYGSQSVVACLDIKKTLFGKYRLYSYITKKLLNESISNMIKRLEQHAIGEILINHVDRDGSMLGYDQELAKFLYENTSVPLLHLGGLASLTDLAFLKNLGYSAGCGGSYFVFSGKRDGVLITYPNEAQIIEYIGNRFE